MEHLELSIMKVVNELEFRTIETTVMMSKPKMSMAAAVFNSFFSSQWCVAVAVNFYKILSIFSESVYNIWDYISFALQTLFNLF